MADINKIIIGYWDCRGLVHSAILMLEYLQKSYEFKIPSKDLIGPAPIYDKSKWHKAKSEILKGYDFPNLPHYFDPKKSVKLTQSNAILMHIARTNDLWPYPEV